MSTPQQKVDDTPNNNNSASTQEVDYEKRYKDTQKAFTKSQQKLKEIEAKYEVLSDLTTPNLQLDDATKTELEDLKFSDPEAWRKKVNKLEEEAKLAHKAKVEEAGKTASIQSELARRAQVLEEYNRSHPELVITDDVIKYDVPPRITAKLEKGEVTFEDFLNEVSSYLNTPKKVDTEVKTLEQPNLGNEGGGDSPAGDSTDKGIVENYKNIVF